MRFNRIIYLNEEFYCETEYQNVDNVIESLEDEGWLVTDVEELDLHVWVKARASAHLDAKLV